MIQWRVGKFAAPEARPAVALGIARGFLLRIDADPLAASFSIRPVLRIPDRK
jgi:hypothetical protein